MKTIVHHTGGRTTITMKAGKGEDLRGAVEALTGHKLQSAPATQPPTISPMGSAILNIMQSGQRHVTYYLVNCLRSNGVKFTQKRPSTLILRELRNLEAEGLVSEHRPDSWHRGYMREFSITAAGKAAISKECAA